MAAADIVARAAAIAKQARSARDARGATVPSPPTPKAPPPPVRSEWWRVWHDGDGVDVFVCPPLTRDELRASFYPRATTILTAGELF